MSLVGTSNKDVFYSVFGRAYMTLIAAWLQVSK